MSVGRFFIVDKEHLLLLQVLCWLGPGVHVFLNGVRALRQVQEVALSRVMWSFVIAIAVAIVFSMMFVTFVRRYTSRILNFPEKKKSVFAFFDLHGYLLVGFFMGLGISLKHLSCVPVEFFASFYPGLGFALSLAGIRFFINWYVVIRKR